MAKHPTQESALYMVQLSLDVRRLIELGRALHLPVQRTDVSYIVHCALGELFGEAAPQPFWVAERTARYARVLGYGPTSSGELKAAAQARASPMVYEICDWPRLASKPMPTSFPEGARLRFETRVCPIVRKAAAGKNHPAGVEVDAFLSKVWDTDDSSIPIDRETVYGEWLLGHLQRDGAAAVHRIQLEHFSLERVLRRRGGPQRKTQILKRPVATLNGELEVGNSTAFRGLLQRGIGRHKSFGFGMLKVRPG